MHLNAKAECQLTSFVQSIGDSFWAPFLGKKGGIKALLPSTFNMQKLLIVFFNSYN